MKIRHPDIKVVFLISCLFVFDACSSNVWKGSTYVGEGTVDGKKPRGENTETFKLQSREAKSGPRRFITMDAANHVLADCGLEVFNRDNETQGRFELSYPDTQCDTLIDGKKITVMVTGGDITISKDEVKLSLVGNDAKTGGIGVSYRFEVTGKRKGWF